MLEPFRFDLKRVRIDLSLPEPLRTTKLNVIRIDSHDLTLSPKQSSSQLAVFNTKADIGDPVLHFGNSICNRQGIQVVSIVLTLVEKMPIAALQRETIRQPVERMYQLNDGGIDHSITETSQSVPSLIRIMRVFNQSLEFCESFQLCCPKSLKAFFHAFCRQKFGIHFPVCLLYAR